MLPGPRNPKKRRTCGRHDGVLCGCVGNLCDALIQVDIFAVNVAQSVLDRARVLLLLDDFLLDVVCKQRSG